MVLTGVSLYNYPTLQGAVAILTILVYALAVVHYKPYQESWMVRSGSDSTPPSTNSTTNDRHRHRLGSRWVYWPMKCCS